MYNNVKQFILYNIAIYYISDKKLGNKFRHFESSVFYESRTLLYEITNNFTFFKRFSRGSIVHVKFGVNIGSEFSGENYLKTISKLSVRKIMINNFDYLPNIKCSRLVRKSNVGMFKVISTTY